MWYDKQIFMIETQSVRSLFLLQKAFEDLGICESEKFAMYKVSAAVVTFGELKFKQRPREEQADIDGTAGKIAY